MARLETPAIAPPAAMTFVPEDAPDWDGARTRRFALRTAQAEFVQGCRSLDVDGWRFQQVDYPYEGLLALLEGENWKFLDSVGIQIRHLGVPVELTGATISVDPIDVTVRHDSPLGVWELGWYLAPHDGASGAILELRVAAPAGLPEGVTFHVLPVFDVRHMYSTSAQDGYGVEVMPNGAVVVCHAGPAIAMRVRPEARFRVKLERVPLMCHMGSGFRYLAAEGVKFQGEERLGQIVGEWILQLSTGADARIAFAVHATPAEALALLGDPREAERREAERRAFREASALAESHGALPGVAERVFVMAHKFGMASLESGVRLPEAGAWWFRTPWFRDVFEGFLSNWQTLDALGQRDRLIAACRMASRLVDPISGRVPNRIPERRADVDHLDAHGRLPDGFYHSVDATTLLFTLLETVGGAYEADLELFLSTFRRAFEAFAHARSDTPDGIAVLGPDGLLRCVPWHAWTDGKRSITYAGTTIDDLPLRVPRAWQVEDLMAGRTPGEVYREQILPTFLLPEINAQWLRMLDWGLGHLPADDPVREQAAQARDKALAAFRPTFWNERAGHFHNLVRADGRADEVPGSPGMVAAVLLLDSRILTEAELRRVWETCRDRLAVRRAGKLFGLLVKASDERIYYGDAQYHEAVVWPRDSTYLAALLARLDEQEALRELLEANLAHQQSEGVLFYNHELFSLPEGKNPSPQPATADFPVPVKNPMQWWSQWCDAYLAGYIGDHGPPGGRRKG